jgi:hypothetical protein
MTKSTIAALAAVITIIAAPAFAGDQNVATELQDSGRYLPEIQARANVPAGAYASARNGGHVSTSQSQANDFQLGGR